MNRIESTFSTTGSVSETKEEMKLTEEKSLALLKLVYYERKSIKQSAKYLKINYNSAKRVVKNFRRGRLPKGHFGETILNPDVLCKTDSFQKESTNNTDFFYDSKSPQAQVTQKTYEMIQNEIHMYSNHLHNLMQEIRQNQNSMALINNYLNRVSQTLSNSNI
jgi:hypothetical protein